MGVYPCAHCGALFVSATMAQEPHAAGCPHASPQTTDWPTFWRSLTPEQAWECLRAAPKVAGAWDEQGRRRAADGLIVASEFDPAGACRVNVRADRVYWSGYPDRPSADAALRAAGWVLVGDETGKDER